MLKGLIKILIIIIIIGIGLSLAGFIVGGFTFADLINGMNSDKDYTLVEKSELLDIDNIVIDCENNIMNITKSADDNFNISYFVAEYYAITYVVTDDTMTITGEGDLQYHIFNFRYPSEAVRTMNIEVPESFNGNIDISTSNGRITIDNINDITKLTLKTSNGKLIIKDINVSNNAVMNTSNGDINLTNLNIGNELSTNTSNGEVIYNNVAAVKISIDNSNGKIELSDVTSDDIDASTSNGRINIDVNGNYNDYKADVSTSNGDITVHNVSVNSQVINPSAAKSVKAHSSNGDIVITFND